MKNIIYIVLCGLLCVACTSKTTKKTAEPIQPAAFSADSAYRYVAEQVAFGARVPGTDAHAQCAAYLMSQLERFGAEVSTQEGAMVNYAGEEQPVKNIIGRFGPADKPAILLCAHWDCRPWSDQETDPDKQAIPVLGANDAASGVGVLLEIARQLGIQQLKQENAQPIPTVEIVFFDVEDMGTPEFYDGQHAEDTWCLGSQLWSKTNQQTAQRADKPTNQHSFGILLDMVGAPNAIFPQEYHSLQYAKPYLERVWQTAEQLGYGSYFVRQQSYPLTDDHYYVNTIAGIPCLDIIHYDQYSGTGFPSYWHTNHDDMKNVAASTLKAVGTTVLTTILGR